MKYALIENGFVTNVVEWDGEGNFFQEMTVIAKEDANIGDAVVDEIFFPRPHDGYDYSFNPEDMVWVLSPESEDLKKKNDELMIAKRKLDLLNSAKNTISIWQSELLLEIISDDEKSKLIKWLNYIDELQASDNPDDWPQPPDA